MAKTKKLDIKKDKNIVELVISNLLNDTSNQFNINNTTDLTPELIDEMIKYPAINTSINTLIRGVASRELIVKSEDNSESDKNILDIQKRVNSIKNKTQLIENIAMACFNRLCLHEIVYNSDFTIKELIHIPNRYIKYDKEFNKFYLIVNNQRIYLDDRTKWLLSINGSGLDSKFGNTLLSDLVNVYVDIKNIKAKLDYIVNKYGDTLLIFAYGIQQTNEEIRETAESLRQAKGKNVIGIPLTDSSLKDNIFTIRLSDIDTVIHERLIDRYDRQIKQMLLGSSLTTDNGNGQGSYSLGQIHQEEKEKTEDRIALFVRDELDKIIDIDGYIFGYDPNQYYISIDREEKEAQRLEIDNKKQDLRQKKMQEILTLSQAGYEISAEELQQITGFKTIIKKEQPTFNI